jgi:hypothetical protein
MTALLRCSVSGCRRHAEPHHALCLSCLTALYDRLFGFVVKR